MVRRFGFIGAIVAVTLQVSAPAAEAKGSSLEIERKLYVSGEPTTARAVFGPGGYEGRLSDGPFHAYVLPWEDRLDPGPIPNSATRVGRLTITPTSPPRCCWVARVEFTIPEVLPGVYALDYCNHPCTIGGIGDLERAQLWIDITFLGRWADRIGQLR